MPWSLKRYQNSGSLHFITFSCYRRQPLLHTPGASEMFEQALEQARVKYGFFVFGYVVMPEHVHLLVSEPERHTLATAIKAIKQSVARRQVKTGEHFWQGRYYDFNVGTRAEESREAEVHPPQPRPSRTGRAPRRLALEQLPPLRHGRGWDCPDRVTGFGLEAETGWEPKHPRTPGEMKNPAQASLERGTRLWIFWLRGGVVRATRRTLLAGSVLRLQRRHRAEESREA